MFVGLQNFLDNALLAPQQRFEPVLKYNRTHSDLIWIVQERNMVEKVPRNLRTERDHKYYFTFLLECAMKREVGELAPFWKLVVRRFYVKKVEANRTIKSNWNKAICILSLHVYSIKF